MPEAEAEQGHQDEGGGMPLEMETVEELPSWESGSSSHVRQCLLCPVIIFGDGEGEI